MVLKKKSGRIWSDPVALALREDVGTGDITTASIVRPGEQLKVTISAEAIGVFAGGPAVKEVYRQLDRRVKVVQLQAEGACVRPGTILMRIQGPAGAILTGERTALNFVGMLSGIATATSRYVAAVKGTRTKILDTRKTTPGLRHLVKYAVAAGGGTNHRIGLFDAILIKDNHIALAQGSILEAVRRVRQRVKHRVAIEVEAENLSQVKEAVLAGADIILIDNHSHADLIKALKQIGKKALTEVSGGITIEAARAAARLGVDRISVGALTHSSAWLSIHMEAEV